MPIEQIIVPKLLNHKVLSRFLPENLLLLVGKCRGTIFETCVMMSVNISGVSCNAARLLNN